MKIIENVFPLEQADYIEDLLTSPLCSWSYLPDSSGNIKDGRKFPSFSKPIYNGAGGATDHEFFLRFEPISMTIVSKAQVKFGDLDRIRFGMHLSDPSWSGYHGVHVDQRSPHTVVLYYVNNSDGDTYFFENDQKTILDRVSPKKNSMIDFDGKIPHASSDPSKGHRITINMNFKKLDV